MKSKSVEILPGIIIVENLDRLYWISDLKPPTNISNSFYFNIDEVDIKFYVGFGI